jgi:3-oxoacyl-[acyl-carrier protein] reductase
MPDRVAVVTGAARGIGFATAQLLAHAGFALAMVDLDAERLERAADELRGEGRDVLPLALDIGAPDAGDAIVAATLERFGRIDGLAHIAGVGVRATQDILEVTQDDYDRCADVNARAAFFILQRFARHFTAAPDDGDRFIAVVTSSNASALSIDRSEYCVSKAAASMATQLFAARLAPHGVSVFEIRPGVISTELTAPRIEAYRARISTEALTAIPRLGDVDDVARCIETAALGLLPYTVGQVINVDGGIQSRRY